VSNLSWDVDIKLFEAGEDAAEPFKPVIADVQ
jgi:hypothetical protein